MTQTGKCDTCRQRKVKCDEERPKCGACRKKDRPCTYSYGKACAFVVQDPNQLTKHGRSKTAPIIWSLDSSTDEGKTSGSTPSDLQITSGRAAGNGQGFFQTLAPMSKPSIRPSKKKAAHSKRMFEAHLQHLQEESALVSVRPSSPETTLIARYIDMLGSQSPGKQPLSILGTWVQSIPSRIGSSRMLDLAAEFLINSYSTYRDDTHSKRKLARATKAKALRELQLIVLSAQTAPKYEVLLATKMHYAAEALMGIDSMYHAIHAYGLAELLRSGAVSGVDDEHYWNLVDNTYIDDVNEAMLAGRKSVYDNEFYLSATYPPAFGTASVQLSPFQRASMAIMHVFIQCPRIVCVIRKAVADPKDTVALASAVSHVESILQLELSQHVSGLIQTSVSILSTPSASDIAHIMPDSLEFDSVQSMVLCTRYWMLQNVLCGFVDALHRYFPAEAALSLLPSPAQNRVTDVDAALHVAKSLRWANSTSQELPLVPLRLHTPLQISIGAWHRTSRQTEALRSTAQDFDSEELSRAERMKTWLIDECNSIHAQWNVSVVEEQPLFQALDAMSGDKIPHWLPVRIRFEAEDGEMVMKLDYENRTGSYAERYDLGEHPPRKRTPHPVAPGQQWQRENLGVHELPLRNTRDSQPDWSSTRPADFIHSTGRNLCSTSGWWPESTSTSTVLLDSTHKASAFSRVRPLPHAAAAAAESTLGDMDSYSCLTSSWWPQSPMTSGEMQSTPSRTADWETRGVRHVTFDNTGKNACFSPAWSGET